MHTFKKYFAVFIRVVLFLSMSLFIFPVYSSAEAQKPIIVRFSHQLPETQAAAMQARVFEKCVKEKSKGNVVIEVYPAAQLFTARDHVSAVRTGAVEMVSVPSTTSQGAYPLMEIWDVPFLFQNYDQVKAAWYGYPGEVLKQDLEKKGVKFMASGTYGFIEVSNSKQEIRSPKDFKGLKLRTPGPMLGDIIQAMGGAPVTLGGDEAYLAMARGTVDGQMVGLTGIVSRKHWEVQKYVSLLHMSYVDMVMEINLQFWKSLPKEVQNLLQECAKESEEFVYRETIKQEKEFVNILREKGMKVYTPTPAEMEEFHKVTAPVKEDWIKKHGEVAAKMVEFVRNLR